MAYDELVQGALQIPNNLSNSAQLLRQFSQLCHSACETMLSRLSEALKLDDANRFERHHRKGESSDSGLKLIYEPSLSKLADVGENKHTDSGTFTILFTDQWGLHVYLPEAKRWAFAAPMPGCGLVNVADSLQRLSGDRLHSPLHRITQRYDGAAKRYFVSYFFRPEDAIKEAWTRGD